MQIRRLFFVQTGTYNDQMLRPYDTTLNRTNLLTLQEATGNGRNLTTANLAGVAGQIIRPSTIAQGVAQIVQGWAETRLRFLIEVVESDAFGGETVQYLTGFTNHVGVSASGHLDQNMEMYFNTSIQTRRMTTMGPTGAHMEQRVNDAAHILTGRYDATYGNLHQATHAMRPQDVFDAVSANTLREFDTDVVDTRTAFSQGKLKKSLRGNSAAPSYLSRLLTTHQAEMAMSDPGDTLGNMMGEAAGAVREPGVVKDTFLHEMMLKTKLVHGGCVLYGDLCRIQPGLDQIVSVFLARGVHAGQNHQRGQTEHWQGTTHETMMATILSHSVPALMMELMLTKVGFNATNRTLNGQTEVIFTGVRTFTEGVDMTPYLQNFEHRLRNEVLSDLSHQNVIDYSLAANFDVVGETVLDLSVAGQPPIRYVTPSFADALFVPILTNDQFVLQKMANDIGTLSEALQVDHSPQNTYHTPSFPENNYGIAGAL